MRIDLKSFVMGIFIGVKGYFLISLLFIFSPVVTEAQQDHKKGCLASPHSRVISMKEPQSPKESYQYLLFVTDGFHEKTHYLALYKEAMYGGIPDIKACELFNREYLIDSLLLPEKFDKLKITIQNNKITIKNIISLDAPYYKVQWK